MNNKHTNIRSLSRCLCDNNRLLVMQQQQTLPYEEVKYKVAD